MKRINILLVAAAVILIMTLCACSRVEEKAPAEVFEPAVSAADVSGTDAADWYAELDETGREIAAVVLSSSDAFNVKDKAGYMAFIDRESEAYDETKRYVNYIFKRYDLVSTIDNVQIGPVSGDTVSVHVTQTTVCTGLHEGGREFADAQTVLLHTMTRRGGEWFITSTVVESRRELEPGWDLLEAFGNGTLSSSDAVVTSSDNVG